MIMAWSKGARTWRLSDAMLAICAAATFALLDAYFLWAGQTDFIVR